MINYTTEYELCNGIEKLKFSSEKEACEFLGVRKSTVSKCYRSGCKCKGYTIKRIGITSHGESRTKLYKIWKSMHERCERKDHPNYRNYGGRGIHVCDEWETYMNFKKWALSHGYKDGLSIDRIDNNGSYYPDNCRFVTIKQQANNRRTNRFLEMNGILHTISEWSDITGVRYSLIYSRVQRGWSLEDAINKPSRRSRSEAERAAR